MTPDLPLHHAQILRTLPQWSQLLPPPAIDALFEHVRPPYLDPAGKAYVWYAEAAELDQQGLLRALDLRQASLAELGRLLAPLKGISEFCAPLLQRRLGLSVSVQQAQYRFQATEVQRPSTIPGGPNVPTEPLSVVPLGPPQLRSLLEAALHNFEGQQDTTRLSQLQHSPDDARPLPGLGMAAFIDHCRTLDLGQRYQAHLSEIYDGPGAADLLAAAVRARRDEFRVQVRVAALRGLINPAWSSALQGLCSDTPLRMPLRCWQVNLFGVPIHELFLARNDDPARDPTVILYWPHSDQPVRAFASLSDVFSHMRTVLTDRDRLHGLVALAPHRLQAELLSHLKRALFENGETDDTVLIRRNTVHLQASEHPLRHSLWAQLESEHISRLKGDARSIAVPTADVDQAVRLKQLAYWLDIGLTVLNVAAMCVPMLNPLMLAIGAAQITGNVFEGVSAWEDGDNAEAMAQLKSILLNVATSAVVVGGGVALKASGFVDAMRSVRLAAGERLWQPSLRQYASEIGLPLTVPRNRLGQYTLDERTYVRIDGVAYEQYQDSEGVWRVRHPRDRSAYAPALVHNGEGAWRLALDSPLHWDFETLLARLGQVDEHLSLDDLRSAWLATGLDAEVLQLLHEHTEPLPVRVKEMIAQLRADQRVTQIIGRVRTGAPLRASDNFALPSLVQLDGWPQDHLIEAFEGAERAGASTLYGRLPAQPGDVFVQISRSELEQGRLAEVVLSQLADPTVLDTPAGAGGTPIAALQTRLAEHLLGQRNALTQRMYHLSTPTLSAAGARLSGQFPGLPVVAVEAIVDGARPAERQAMLAAPHRIPLRVLEEARVMQAQVRLDRALLGLYRPSLANADTRALIDGLHAQHPESSGAALWRLAIAERDRCADLIGQQPIRPRYRSPMALNHGRLGYALSGRGVPRRLHVVALRQLQSLYPGLDEAQLIELRRELTRAGDFSTMLRLLEQELATLKRDLQTWAGRGTTAVEREERLRFTERLVAVWRRLGNTPRSTLTMQHLHIGELPAISARFAHIRSVSLENLALQRISGAFLECFPNIERLSIVQNSAISPESMFQALRAVPNLIELDLSSNGLPNLGAPGELALGAMRRLRTLTLRRNRLALDDADMTLLTRLPLDTLNLSNNGITLTQAQALRFQNLVHPERLNLEFNPLGIAPDLRFMARLSHLDLSHCRLNAWPEGLTTLMSQAQYRLRLIELSDNRIHAMPDLDAVLATPFARDLAARVPDRAWRMNYNGMESRLRTRLLRAGADVFEHGVELSTWQARWLTDATPAQYDLWSALFENGENQVLAGVLERLSDSAEAQRSPQALRVRVWHMLERAGTDDTLLQALNQEAQAFPATCGDAGADAFSALEVRLLIEDASLSADPLHEQLQVFGQLYRREQVNVLAERIAWHRSLRKAALQAAEYNGDESHLPALDELDDVAVVPDIELVDGLVDDIEIRLALRQALAVPLNYPEPSAGMLYEQVAQINQRIRNNVRDEVLRLERNAPARRQWLLDQPQWQRALRARNAEQFESLTDFWRSGLDYLDYCLDEHAEAMTRLPDSVRLLLEDALQTPLLDVKGNLRRVVLNSGQYQIASERLLQQLKEVEHGLLESLTKALEQRPS